MLFAGHAKAREDTGETKHPGSGTNNRSEVDIVIDKVQGDYDQIIKAANKTKKQDDREATTKRMLMNKLLRKGSLLSPPPPPTTTIM